MKHIRTIINKEWAEVFKNRMVLFAMIFIPLIFTVLPLVMLYLTNQGMDDFSSTATADVPALANRITPLDPQAQFLWPPGDRDQDFFQRQLHTMQQTHSRSPDFSCEC